MPLPKTHLFTPSGKPRARRFAIPFDGVPGQNNAITDVPGLSVGYATLVSGDGPLVVGKGPVRTGVTAILPRPRAELPAPVPQFWVKVAGRRYRLDFAYPEVKLAIEVDGFDPHNTRTAFDKDRARANDLVAAGWTVLRFTSESTQAHIASSVRATLARLTQAS